jgi:hypothetical protein
MPRVDFQRPARNGLSEAEFTRYLAARVSGETVSRISNSRTFFTIMQFPLRSHEILEAARMASKGTKCL